jgi:hypothetical protein
MCFLGNFVVSKFWRFFSFLYHLFFKFTPKYEIPILGHHNTKIFPLKKFLETIETTNSNNFIGQNYLYTYYYSKFTHWHKYIPRALLSGV